MTTIDKLFGGKFRQTRFVGMFLHLLWMFVLFYTLAPFFLSTNPRESSYLFMVISLGTLALTLIFLFVTLKRDETFERLPHIVVGASLVMAFGTLLALPSDPNNTFGMLALGIGAISTGVGSSVLYIAWLHRFTSGGRSRLFKDLSLSFVAALVVTTLIAAAPAPLGCAVVIACPFISALLFVKTRPAKHKETPAHHRNLSRSSYILFAKGLAGAFVFGILQGSLDVNSGREQTATLMVYGMPLLILSLVSLAILAVISHAAKADGVFPAYRLSVFIMFLGCLLLGLPDVPFFSSGAVIFAGYLCFTVTLVAVCADIAHSFKVGSTRVLCLGFSGLFIGEVVGVWIGLQFGSAFEGLSNAYLAAAAAATLLVFAHLFLFTETDLALVGVGELVEVGEGAGAGAGAGAGGDAEAGAGGDAEAVVGENVETSKTIHVEDEHSTEFGGNSASKDSALRDDTPQDSAQAGNSQTSNSQVSVFQDSTSQDSTPQTPSKNEVVAAALARRYKLSPRESEVLPLLLQGRTIVRIQEALFISQGTVSTHIRHIYQKCGVETRQELLDLRESIAQELTS